MGMPVPPPMFLPGGLAPYPPAAAMPRPLSCGDAAAHVVVERAPAEHDLPGHRLNFGHFPKGGDLEALLGFIKVDHARARSS